jgi:hypothetical protein
MDVHNPLPSASHQPLSGPFATPPSTHGVQPGPAVLSLVQSQVRALLDASPAVYGLSPETRESMERDLTKIAAYSAALVQEDWAISQRLGQTPVLRSQSRLRPRSTDTEALPRALAAHDPPPPPASEEFVSRAASQVAGITRETLNAVSFPTFVADLIKGSFHAIVVASIEQMEAYGKLLANVAKTVDQFTSDNTTDNQARDYLAQTYPSHLRLEVGENGARLRTRENTDGVAPASFRQDFGLSSDVDLSDDSAEEVLIPAARRKIAQDRHQLLSTMVLMGINRIVITSGSIKAKMGFRIQAHDAGGAQTASQFDTQTTGSTGMGGGLVGLIGGANADVKHSVTYVSSSKKESADDLNVETDLTGEVNLHFKSDYFPLERFADTTVINRIQNSTPNPAANSPTRPAAGPAVPAAPVGAGA